MKRLAFAAITVTTFCIAPLAYGADLPAPLPYKAPIYSPVPVYNWTGFYIGANAGWGWTSGDGTITIGGASGPVSGSGNGFLGGVQAGYNLQTGPIVFGFETDFQGSTSSGNVSGSAGATTFSGTAKTPWFGTIRGRVGYAMNRWLFYVTGGGVYGESTLDGTVNTTGAFSSSATYWAWTVGGGVETALWDNWTGKLEYLYVGTPNNSPVPPGTTALSGNTNTNIVRAGLNYRF